MKSLKQIATILIAIAKAKSTFVKSKKRAIRAQLMISKLLHDRKVMMGAVSQNKQPAKDDGQAKICNNEIMPYNSLQIEDGNRDVLGDDSCSVTDFIRNSQQEGLNFELENEIDKAADVFIRRFHSQMRIQKQESFKRYLEMLERSV